MKYITLILLALVTTSAHANFWDNCTAAGGTIITANSYGNDKGGYCNDPNNSSLSNNCNGKKFCRTYSRLNWWAAFTWCEAIGGKLASVESMCPSAQIQDNTRCANLAKTGGDPWLWTNMGLGTKGACVINPGAGTVSTGWERTSGQSPFCEEK